MGKLTVFVRLTCKPGKKEEVMRIMAEKCTPYMDESDGYDVFFISNGIENENEIHVLEYFSDGSVYWDNCEADWFLAYKKEIEPLLEKPTEAFRGEPVHAKGYPF